jgi:integrase/recombinase XerD
LRDRCRPNTVLATAYDLKIFFAVVGKDPGECPALTCSGSSPRSVMVVTAGYSSPVMAGVWRRGRCGAGCRACRGCSLTCTPGVMSRTNPVPRGLPTRRERQRPRQGVPLVRSTRTLPRVLMPGEVDALLAALRRQRDRAMVLATVLGGLRRCEVLGLRLEDLHVGQRRVFIGEGKGGHQRIVPVSARFFTAAAAYLEAERPAGIGTDRLFVALKGRRRGEPLSAYGVDEILSGATRRAGRRHPRETARHPHQSCRPVAARRSRRLDNLRRRLQPPCEHLNHESRATVDSAAPETDSEGFNI